MKIDRINYWPWRCNVLNFCFKSDKKFNKFLDQTVVLLVILKFSTNFDSRIMFFFCFFFETRHKSHRFPENCFHWKIWIKISPGSGRHHANRKFPSLLRKSNNHLFLLLVSNRKYELFKSWFTIKVKILS